MYSRYYRFIMVEMVPKLIGLAYLSHPTAQYLLPALETLCLFVRWG